MAICNHNGLVLLQMILLLWAIKESSEPLKCLNRCGDVDDIEYPFGIGEGCYLDKSFEVVCDNSSGSPKAVLKSINLTVYGFGSKFVIVNVSVIALNSSSSSNGGEGVNMTGTPFYFSQRGNRFTATGCDDFPKQKNKQNDSSSEINGVRCQSICRCDPAPKTGCCDLMCTLPPNTKVFDGNTSYMYSQTTPQECTYALIVQQSWPFVNYRRNELVLKDQEHVPAVLEWANYKGDCYEELDSHSSRMCNKDNRCLIQLLGSGYYCLCRSENSDFCSGDLFCNTTSGHNCSECPHGRYRSGYYGGEPQCFPMRSIDSFILSQKSRDKLIVIGCTSVGLGMFILLIGAWRFVE